MEKAFFRMALGLALFLALPLMIFGQMVDEDFLQMKVDVIYLSSDNLEGREPGTQGGEEAANYIAWRFGQIGLKPVGRGHSWFQPFEFSFRKKPHDATSEQRRMGKNVLGYLDNGAATTVVITAHYDHLGYGVTGSRYLGSEPAIHNGADDNASGVALMMYLAEKLKEDGPKSNNYLFIAFSAEEFGLIGSKFFVEHPTLRLEDVNYVINLDMVGRLKEDGTLIVNGAGTSPAWKDALAKIRVGNIHLKTFDSGVGPSDHTSFYLKNLPVLHFFSGQHEDYHKPGDDSALINFAGMYDIGDFILQLIAALDGQDKLAFAKTKDEQQEGRRAAKYKVTLGVMPDYAFTGKGLKVDGVREEGPAAKAGIQAGDVILKMGETEVNDIYGYMEGLAQYKAGDKTKVVLLREGKEIQVQVQF